MEINISTVLSREQHKHKALWVARLKVAVQRRNNFKRAKGVRNQFTDARLKDKLK
jgi:hypothetical protein